MSLFRYEAARPDGAVVRGQLEATSGPEIAALLSRRGLLPVSVTAVAHARAWPWHGPSARAQAILLQSLASLVEAGVSLQEALRVSARLAPRSLGAAFSRVEGRVREGATLASALASEPGLLPAVAIGLVRAGERGAGLGPALAQAAETLERRAEMRARVRAALAYPLVLGVVGLVSAGFILLVIVPRFAALLGDSLTAAPAATRLLVEISGVVRRHGFLLLGFAVAGGVAAVRSGIRQSTAWHRWLLDVPLIGPIRHALASARTCRSLGALLAAGTPALQALEVARESVADDAVAARLVAARDRVAEGASLSAALEAANVLTPGALQLAAIGDRAGRLPELLARAAELEDGAAERRLRAVIGLVEPALILGFAGVVAFVAAALLQAIYSVRPGSW